MMMKNNKTKNRKSLPCDRLLEGFCEACFQKNGLSFNFELITQSIFPNSNFGIKSIVALLEMYFFVAEVVFFNVNEENLTNPNPTMQTNR